MEPNNELPPQEIRPVRTYNDLSNTEKAHAILCEASNPISAELLGKFMGISEEMAMKEIQNIGLQPLTEKQSVLLKLNRAKEKLKNSSGDSFALENTIGKLEDQLQEATDEITQRYGILDLENTVKALNYDIPSVNDVISKVLWAHFESEFGKDDSFNSFISNVDE